MTVPVGGCPFCDIVAGMRPASKVLDDERVVAFLDRHPINAGHVLVVPRVHAPSFYDLAEEDFVPVMLAARQLALALDGIYRPRKVGMLAAGLDVDHVHIHVLPMHDYHDITSRVILDGTRRTADDEELNREAGRIRSALSSSLRVVEP